MTKQLPSSNLTKHLQCVPPTLDSIIEEDRLLAVRLIQNFLDKNKDTYGSIMCYYLDSNGNKEEFYGITAALAWLLQKAGFHKPAKEIVDHLYEKCSLLNQLEFPLETSEKNKGLGCMSNMVWALATGNYKVLEILRASPLYSNGLLSYSSEDEKKYLGANIFFAIVEEILGGNPRPILEKIAQNWNYSGGLIRVPQEQITPDMPVLPGTLNATADANCLLAIALSKTQPDAARNIVELLKNRLVDSNNKIKPDELGGRNYDSGYQALWYLALRSTGMEYESAITPIREDLRNKEITSLGKIPLPIFALLRETI